LPCRTPAAAPTAVPPAVTCYRVTARIILRGCHRYLACTRFCVSASASLCLAPATCRTVGLPPALAYLGFLLVSAVLHACQVCGLLLYLACLRVRHLVYCAILPLPPACRVAACHWIACVGCAFCRAAPLGLPLPCTGSPHERGFAPGSFKAALPRSAWNTLLQRDFLPATRSACCRYRHRSGTCWVCITPRNWLGVSCCRLPADLLVLPPAAPAPAASCRSLLCRSAVTSAVGSPALLPFCLPFLEHLPAPYLGLRVLRLCRCRDRLPGIFAVSLTTLHHHVSLCLPGFAFSGWVPAAAVLGFCHPARCHLCHTALDAAFRFCYRYLPAAHTRVLNAYRGCAVAASRFMPLDLSRRAPLRGLPPPHAVQCTADAALPRTAASRFCWFLPPAVLLPLPFCAPFSVLHSPPRSAMDLAPGA